jgi:hypothetical protein
MKTSTTIIPAFALALLLGLGFLSKGAWVYAERPVSRVDALATEGTYQCCSSPDCDSTITPTKIGRIGAFRAEEKATGAEIFSFFSFSWLDRDSTRSLSLEAGSATLETATNLASENPSISFQGTMPISGFYFLSGQGEGTPIEGTLTVQGQIQARGDGIATKDKENEGDVEISLPDIEIFREILRFDQTSWEDATITGTGSLSLNDPVAEALLPPELSGEFDLGFAPCNPATGSFSSTEETGIEIQIQFSR